MSWLSERVRATPRAALGGTLAGIVLFLVVAAATFGIRPEQVGVCLLVLFALVYSPGSRRFLLGILPFVILGVVFDLSRLLKPLLELLTVHVKEPYAFDKALFGISSAGGTLTPNEFFRLHHAPWLDFVTGLAYIAYLYEAMGFGLYLAVFRRTSDGRRLLARFGWVFLGVNLMGFATYYIYPAAPPWYVELHGFGPVDLSTPPHAAAALRWDELTGIPYFRHFYARGASVFGAIPSLHAAYPLIVFFYARELGKRWLTVGTFAFFCLVCFSAVYLQHHYVLDVGVGALYAVVGCLVERVVTRRFFRRAAFAA